MKFENNIKRGILHCHTQYSLFDSAVSLKMLLDKAQSLGAPAIMVSDHGTGMAFEEMRNISAKYPDMKLIYAVEFYVNYEPLQKRTHLIMAAKDIRGYKAIIKLLTKSNHNIDSKGMPIVNFSDLEEFFGKGKEYEDSVLVTSACMGGVIATPLLSNFYLDEEIKKIENKMKGLPSPYSPTFLAKKEKEKMKEKEIEELSSLISSHTELAKKPYKKKLSALKKLEGDPDFLSIKENLEKEMKESEEASRLLPLEKKEREEKKREWRKLRDENAKIENSHEKYFSLDEKRKEAEGKKESEDALYRIAVGEAEKYRNLFGNNFYMELQNHRIAQEKYVMPILANIAKELNIPVIAANDAHMVGNSDDEIKARQIMRSLRYNKWETVDDSDREMYVKTDEELYAILCEILPESVAEQAMLNVEDFVAKCNVVHENGFHYPKFKSEIKGETAGERLRRLAEAGIERRYPGRKGWTKEHEARLEYELGVIHKLGYDDYLNIVEDFLAYGRLMGKIDAMHPDPRITDENRFDMDFLRSITKNCAGYGIGPGRGSGVGSLVNYLVGITGVDPIRYGLIFERFLNVERVSPPDIDSDVKSDIRDSVIQYIEWKYGGSDAVCGIMTKSTQQAKAAIRNCARLLGSEMYDDTKAFLDLGDQICKAVPQELGIKLSDCEDELREKFKDNANAIKIIDNAKLVEGKFTNVGIHAAGVVIADNGDVSSYVPLMYVSGKDRFVTQCDKVEVEKKNLLKMDALGLKNLKIITDALQMIQKKTGKIIDMESDVDVCDASVYKNIFASGNTDSVFQFESAGMKKLLKQFKPEKMEHLIMLNALYRPGPIQYIDPIIEVKNGKKVPEYIIPEMKEILGETYGFPVYQEQIMTIFNKFAGFTLGEADIVRRAMSKKHLEELAAYKDKFIEGMIERGAEREKVEKFWQELLEFSKYAFNKSHSCAYSHVAFYTAWLKYYYPREYLSAVMNTTDFDKIGGVIAECRHENIKMLPVDVNKSVEKFSVFGDAILYGLGLVKEVGSSAETIIEERSKNGPFNSLFDFVFRTRANKTVVENLISVGGFDAFCKNRSAMLDVLLVYLDILKKIKTQEGKLNDADEKKREKAQEKINNLIEDMQSVEIDLSVPESFKKKLETEKELSGAYISAHPIDFYELSNIGATPISALEKCKKVTVVGAISNLDIKKRKSDGKEMAFFTLDDKDGIINVCCFTDCYEKFSGLIKDGDVIKIEGSISEDERGENEEPVLKLNAKTISEVKERTEKVCVQISSIVDWVERVRNIALQYQDEEGCQLVVLDRAENRLRKSSIRVSKDILSDKGIEGFLTV